MPLYSRRRDRLFLRRINEELLQKIIGVEVAIYKHAIQEMNPNIYGESSEKVYYNPVRVHALVTNDDSILSVNEAGQLSKDKTLSIAFLRDELEDLGLVVEISDIMVWDDGYYQVDNVRNSNYWWGRNPASSIPVQEGDSASHGYAVSVIAEVHRTDITNLNLVETRSGTNKISTKSKLPRNL